MSRPEAPDPVVACLREIGRRNGWERRGKEWLKRSPQVATVLGLQRSQYSSAYYLNVGFYFVDGPAARLPPAHLCHVVGRVAGLSGDAERVGRALDPGDASVEETRCADLEWAVRAVIDAAAQLPTPGSFASPEARRLLRHFGFRAEGLALMERAR